MVTKLMVLFDIFLCDLYMLEVNVYVYITFGCGTNVNQCCDTDCFIENRWLENKGKTSTV